MRRLRPVGYLVVGVVVGVVGVRSWVASAPAATVRQASAASFVPACPHVMYGEDGTIGPIFCTIDNPVALDYYASALKPLLKLGPNATPGQVQRTLTWEYHHGGPHGEVLTGTLPIQCQVFQLAAHYWRWSFPYSPQYCSIPPSNAGGNS